MSKICPSCGHTNRDTAKFCSGCGGDLAAIPQALPKAVDRVKEAAAKAGAVVGPAAAKAGAAVAPVAKEAAIKSWKGSKKGMGFMARTLTGGGKAAYTEVFSPQPYVEGQVLTAPASGSVPAPIEVGALLFVAALLLGWLIFLLEQWWYIAAALAGTYIVLLVLSWLGLRQPFFTRMTFSGLWSRLFRRSGQVPIYKFRVQDRISGQPVDVVMVGPQKGHRMAPGNNVRVWGLPDKGRNELRAWKVEALDAAGQTFAFLTVPRLIPLVVALFLPPTLILITWIVILLVR
jgi:hypothetical protein